MIFGAITNSWTLQLADQPLAALIEEARDRGARHIELRATCLADCETGDGGAWRPIPGNLQALVDRFPDLGFNLAVPFPCLTEQVDPAGEQFQAALTAARLVGRDLPHLRTVDGSSFPSPWEAPEQIPAAALGIAALVREAASQGVLFSVENVGQPLRSMALLVQQVRTRLTPEDGCSLGLCIDLINQLRAYPESDPLAELEALPLKTLAMVHFKQTRERRPHPTVDRGDLDCLRMRDILQAKQYTGPAVLEIPPHAEALDNLTASFGFLRSG